MAPIHRRTVRNLAFVALVVVPSVLLAQYKGSIPPPADFKTGWDAITVDLAKQHLGYLAGPECNGRGTGQAGYYAAANYVAARFKEMGIVPVSGDSYFQGVPFTRTGVDLAETSLSGPGIDLKVGKGLGFIGSPGEASVSAEDIVFINMKDGSEALPEAFELAGKVVVAAFGTMDNAARNKFFAKNPAAVLMVVDKAVEPEARIGRGAAPGGGRGRGGRLIASIERRYALDLARAVGVDPSLVVSNGLDSNEVSYREAKGKVALNVKVKTEEISVPNVVGMLPGSDPELGKEYIGIGAHLDHLGISNGVVYPGADDDGSGSTAMLLVAKALTSNPVKPKRTIVFMAFCGEEMGLVGSAFYSDNPLIPLDRMTCLLQMDMVGRNEETANEKASDNINTMHLVGSKRISMQLHNITLEANKYVGFEFEYDQEDVYSRSDHAMFARKGVPITFVFSGFHPDYHQPTDTIDKINFDKIVSTARLNYMVVNKIGYMAEQLKHDGAGD